MKIISDNAFYKSSDLCLSAVISMDYPIEDLDRTNPGKIVFIFRRNTKIDKLVQAFWGRELNVEPRAYFDAIKSLKSRLYQE